MEKTAWSCYVSDQSWGASLKAAHTWGCMATFSGAVDGCAPTGAGPSGRARCRKESVSDMVVGLRLPLGLAVW
jgi:hypothetical protein